MGLQQIGKTTGAILRSKMKPTVDRFVTAFMEYGRSLKEKTLLLHQRTLLELYQYVKFHGDVIVN